MAEGDVTFRNASFDGVSTLPRQKRRKAAEIRKVLDEHFKRLFDGAVGGIQMQTLVRHIEAKGISENIPVGKMNQLLKMYDEDRNNLVSYKEFTKMMLNESDRFDLSKLSRLQRVVLHMTSTAVPQSKQEDFISYYTCKPPPIFMILISLAELGVYGYYTYIFMQEGMSITSKGPVAIGSPLIFDPERRYEVWRYLTYIFIHVGYVHLISNLLFQLFVGIPLEMVNSWWRVLLIYGCGAITGSLAHSVCDSTTFLAGASGGAYSVAIAHVANVVMNWEEMQVDWLKGVGRFLLSAPVRLVFILLIACTDTGVALYNRFGGSGSGAASQTVGIAAHFGGMLTGLLLGIPLLRNVDKKPWETVVFWVALVIYILLVVFAVLWNAFYPNFPPSKWS